MFEQQLAVMATMATSRAGQYGRTMVAYVFVVMASSLAVSSVFAAAQDDALFAVVNNEAISAQVFETDVKMGMRKRFYHGKVTSGMEAAFRHEVAEDVLDRVILLQEIERREMRVDDARLESLLKKTMADYRNRMRDDAQWAAAKMHLESSLRLEIRSQLLLEALKVETEQVSLPQQDAVEAYYGRNKSQFTTPERLRVSLVLLAVQPWAEQSVWSLAVEEAERLIGAINEGRTEFAQAARLHSSDRSAESGGDLGFIHQGMLAQEAQVVLDKMKVDEISQPVRLLKGIAILRLDERIAPQLNDFEVVSARAGNLLLRELKQAAWGRLKTQLRNNARVWVNPVSLKATAL